MKNTEEKLAIMTAWVRGEPIEVFNKETKTNNREVLKRDVNSRGEPAWNWMDYDYSIKVEEQPKPAAIPADNGAAMALKGMNDAIMLGKLSAQIDYHKAYMQLLHTQIVMRLSHKPSHETFSDMEETVKKIHTLMCDIQKLGI